MTIRDFIEQAKKDEPVYITEVEKAFNAFENKSLICIKIVLVQGDKKDFSFYLPKHFEDKMFVKAFFFGKIYNIISTLGGKKLVVYYDTANQGVSELVNQLNYRFGIREEKSKRNFYARSINVADRLNEALFGGKFSFELIDIREYEPEKETSTKEVYQMHYIETVDSLNGAMCGIDIGGTDIKLAVADDGNMVCFKEYDWYPASYPTMDEIIAPVVSLIKLLRIKVTNERLGGNEMMRKQLEIALDKHAKLSEIEACVQFGESLYKDRLVLFDGIGMCFPDVVVQNKIVGGEVSKVKSVRTNPNVDFEKEFRRLSDLDVILKMHCTPEGCVHMTNDGPMAAYTAAIELAYANGEKHVKDGVFAHTLGTELGTGWVDEKGEIPEIPLEAYNYVIDLGSYAQSGYECDDLRSIKNFNTDIPGTVQKYTSQYGVFRLAIKNFKKDRPDLYKEMFEKGFVVERDGGLYVPTEPIDLRKPFLEFVMGLPDREHCPVCERIFKEIGEHLAIVWKETEDILSPLVKERVLFGRLVKNKTCFKLMQEGAKTIAPEMTLSVADSDLANTPLMKQLKIHPDYTVAQFAQAVGAIYFAMSIRK